MGGGGEEVRLLLAGEVPSEKPQRLIKSGGAQIPSEALARSTPRLRRQRVLLVGFGALLVPLLQACYQIAALLPSIQGRRHSSAPESALA